MKQLVRHTTFFRLGSNLAVFDRLAVDVRARKAVGLPVTLKELRMDPLALLDDGIKRHFWVVTKYPEELILRLDVDNHAVRGTPGYEVARPRDTDALTLLQLAEGKANAELFADETVGVT